MSCSRERISWFYDYFHLGLVLIVLDFFYKFLLFYWHLVKLTKWRQLEKISPQFSSTCSMLMNVCSYQLDFSLICSTIDRMYLFCFHASFGGWILNVVMKVLFFSGPF